MRDDAQHFQHSRMMRIIKFVKLLVLTVDCKRILSQVVGADAEKIDKLCKLGADHDGGRRFDHDAAFNLVDHDSPRGQLGARFGGQRQGTFRLVG